MNHLEDRTAKEHELVALLLERIDLCERGEAVPVPPDYFDRLRGEFLDRVARKQAS